MPQVLRIGRYYGSLLWVRQGEWRVSVSVYRGWTSSGHQWQSVPAASIFRADVLARQLYNAGLVMTVEFKDGRLQLRPPDESTIWVSTNGRSLKDFMERHYAVTGQDQNKIHWKWDVRQYS